jgi:hypothetical protein
MEAERATETVVSGYQSTRRNIAEGLRLYQHRLENLKSPVIRFSNFVDFLKNTYPFFLN